MKRLILILSCITYLNLFSQSKLDGYKYVVCEDIEYKNGGKDIWGISNQIRNAFRKVGMTVFSKMESAKKLDDYKKRTLFIDVDHTEVIEGYNHVYITIKNIEDEQIYYLTARAITLSRRGDYKAATKKALAEIVKLKYKFNPDLGVKDIDLSFDMSAIGLDYASEEVFREYFKAKGFEYIEGIWEITGAEDTDAKVAIIKNKFNYSVVLIGGTYKSARTWRVGEVKAKVEPAASDEIVTIIWTMSNKKDIKKTIGTVKANSLIEFNLNDKKAFMYKVYPKIAQSSSKSNRLKTAEWAGNGSGIIISKSGYIATNHHVIEDANDIEVEFILNGELQKFNAEVVQSDKVNDLAIIKIFDMNFDGLDNLPYNFKTRSSDVGTKVYAYGYPMALSSMGKEIKITDGIISSKSGFDGNITTYQISAPIQAGNSGGPLFDSKGNFIGINSAGLSKDVADNVGYTIKSSYVLNLIDVLPKSIELPSSTKLQSLPLTEQIKEISKCVVLVKVK